MGARIAQPFAAACDLLPHLPTRGQEFKTAEVSSLKTYCRADFYIVATKRESQRHHLPNTQLGRYGGRQSILADIRSASPQMMLRP